jgi:hypothetical protein
MGLKALLDTNAIIALLKNEGNLTNILRKILRSIFSSDLILFDRFLSRIIVIDLTQSNVMLLNEIITNRKIKILICQMQS